MKIILFVFVLSALALAQHRSEDYKTYDKNGNVVVRQEVNDVIYYYDDHGIKIIVEKEDDEVLIYDYEDHHECEEEKKEQRDHEVIDEIIKKLQEDLEDDK